MLYIHKKHKNKLELNKFSRKYQCLMFHYLYLKCLPNRHKLHFHICASVLILNVLIYGIFETIFPCENPRRVKNFDRSCNRLQAKVFFYDRLVYVCCDKVVFPPIRIAYFLIAK